MLWNPLTTAAVNAAGLKVGQPVATLTYGGFSEFAVEQARFVVPVPTPSLAMVAFLTSGLTASVSLDEARPQRGETALVTAAAGGTGLFAVQLLKHAGLHVVGTCGSESKAQVLHGLGVDRVVNYKSEDLKTVRDCMLAAPLHQCMPSWPTRMYSLLEHPLAANSLYSLHFMPSHKPATRHCGELLDSLMSAHASM